MLELNYIRNNKERVIQGLKIRNFSDEDTGIVEQIIETDDLRKKTQTELDLVKSEKNNLSKAIGGLFKQGKKEEAGQMREQVNGLKEKEASLGATLNEAKTQLESLLLKVPNVPNEAVPPGKTDEDNIVFKDWDKPFPELGDDALPHWELAKKYGVFDLELGVKLTGAGFPVYRGKGARLQRALIAYFLDEAAKAGYEEILPPLMVNEHSAKATGQLPDKDGQMYHVERDGLYLIPTAEVPVTNIYRDVILEESDFPIKMAGHTPCFRREAGSYGAHVRGINRVHQFDKVEIVRISHPDKSYEALNEMLAHVHQR